PHAHVTLQITGGNLVTTPSRPGPAPIPSTPLCRSSCTANPKTAVAGVATFVGCKIDKAGTGYTLTTSDGSLASATSATFNITVGPAAKLALTPQPSNTTGTAAIATLPKVTVQHTAGNKARTDSSSVPLAIGTNPSSAT